MTAPAAGHERTTVAVGYDGSEAAKEAVRWAAEYAAAGKYRLRVVHAWVWPMFTKKLGPVKGVEGSGLRHSAESILAEGVELARTALAAARTPADAAAETVSGEPATETGPDVEGVMETGLPAAVLRDAAGDARLLVVSSRGLGGVLGQLAGSVCLDLAGSSPCPLMVVRRLRSPGEPVAPVVVGIDGTSRSSEALSGAARLAVVLGTALRIVHIDQTRGGTRESHGRHGPLRGQELLDHANGEARNQAPQLSISVDLREGHAASKELLAAASDADILVIGTHNREGGPGNTVTAVLNKARCNVLITR
ncbi:nucleotide-binding universal stress UspA family protein [Arthrobacter ginsengisoli]|uniref:Nucleotide-binding universal stress UspA family protein n=1 Tax=Arthrobacter ginsengisoli TaxID=1356565 RepID=A0ABU1U9C9_9MICC|nr:universal stress protein [Arthrobacter ginsengisoli]MDR7081793.1 nucleotide-binding universal stress UspA family protein [Arthrobacter ginsengisoli]